MKRNWKAMAAGLALLVGVSGAAFGAARDHDGDRGRNNIRVERRDGDHDRDNRWRRDDDERRGWYNNSYRDRDRDWDRDRDRRVYNYNPYYGNNGYWYNGYYYGNPYRR